MPLIKMQTTNQISEDKQNDVMKKLSDIISECTGKPASYVMVTIEQTPIMLAEKSGNAALFDIRGIGGLNQEVNAAITRHLCEYCNAQLNIPQDRVYANFTDVPRSNWGWNGNTF